MANGLAVRNLMLLICLGSLMQMFEYCGETEGTTGTNLIGRSTSNELVGDVRLVLGALLVLDPVAISTAQHTSRRTSIRYCNPERAGGRRRKSP
jgi:hypothetical protein